MTEIMQNEDEFLGEEDYHDFATFQVAMDKFVATYYVQGNRRKWKISKS
jgi:hypothetical protein